MFPNLIKVCETFFKANYIYCCMQGTYISDGKSEIGAHDKQQQRGADGGDAWPVADDG